MSTDQSLSAPTPCDEFAGSPDEVLPEDPSFGHEEDASEDLDSDEIEHLLSLDMDSEEFQAMARDYISRLSDSELARRLGELRREMAETEVNPHAPPSKRHKAE